MKLTFLFKHILTIYIIVLLALCSLFTISCKKEYIDKYNIVPGDTITIADYTYINTFAISEYSADTILQASITKDSIIVYWPMYKEIPETIKPKITLPEGASISPASETEVTFEEGTTYTVTAQSGNEKKYALHIVFLQAKPWFSYPLGSNIVAGEVITMNSGQGEWFLPDTHKTKIFLISALDNTKQYEAEVLRVNNNGPMFIVPIEVPAGNYSLKITNGLYTIYDNNPESKITVLHQQVWPRVYNELIVGEYHMKPNQEITFRGYNLLGMGIKSAMLGTRSNNALPVQILDYKNDRITIKIPGDFPEGTYRALDFFNENNVRQVRVNSYFYITK